MCWYFSNIIVCGVCALRLHILVSLFRLYLNSMISGLLGFVWFRDSCSLTAKREKFTSFNIFVLNFASKKKNSNKISLKNCYCIKIKRNQIKPINNQPESNRIGTKNHTKNKWINVCINDLSCVEKRNYWLLVIWKSVKFLVENLCIIWIYFQTKNKQRNINIPKN